MTSPAEHAGSGMPRYIVPLVAAVLGAGLVAAGLIPIPAVILSIPFLVIMARRPVQRRLAFRNVARRPRETLLILIGALLGTAIITGSAIVGDTLGASIRRSAFTQLGPADLFVRTSGLEAFPAVTSAVEAVQSPDIDGVLPLLTVGASVATVGDDPQAEPNSRMIEVDFARAATFGGDPEATGMSGATPTGDSVVIGKDLARTLDVEPGDTVDVYTLGAKRTYVVDRVLPRLGIAGLRTGFGGSASPNVFVPSGTIAELAVGAPAEAAPPNAAVAVSLRGGVIEGGDRVLSERVKATLNAAVAGLPATTSVIKADLLEGAEEAGADFTELFSSIGFFSVIAGIFLLVMMFVMLAEERKTELGMLRAVGMRRADLVGSFSVEGWMYAVASAAVGTLVGLLVGRLIVLAAANIFADEGQFSLELVYTATLASIQRGFMIGFVMSLVTVIATAIGVSRLNVIQAIRDLPPDPSSRQRGWLSVVGAGVLVVGLVLTVSGLSARDPGRTLGGPAVIGAGAILAFRRFLPRRPLVTVVSAAVLFWAVACFDIASRSFRNPEIYLFVMDGLILTVFTVALVSQNQDIIGASIRRIGGGSRSMALRLGLAYPLAKRVRTGMILTMYSLVVFVMASLLLFTHVFGSQIDDFEADVSGGFDLKVFSNSANPVPVDAVKAEPGVVQVAALETVGAEFRTRLTGGEFKSFPAGGFDQTFVDQGPPALEKWIPEFANEREAYQGVLAHPNLIIVNEFFLQQGGGPPDAALDVGDKVEMLDPVSGRSKEMIVGAMSEAGFDFTPATMSLATVNEVFGDRAAPDLLYVATAPEVDAQEVAESINGKYIPNGADAISFRKSVQTGLQQQQSFFRLMEGYLALGLLVGIAGLGVVAIRAVRERRRQIGVLRSLGFESRQVRRAFIAESAFVALEGIFIGVSLATVSTWRLLGSGAFGDGLEFGIPWIGLAFLIALAFGASLLATITPAQQASKIRPAVALRIAD